MSPEGKKQPQLCWPNVLTMEFLFIAVPPSIESEGDVDLKVIQDRSITLPCQVSGDPRPQITWTKNGVRIAESDPHYFISEQGSLEIFSADPQDTATYSCTAINVAGVKEKRITLFVQGNSKSQNPRKKIVARAGTRVSEKLAFVLVISAVHSKRGKGVQRIVAKTFNASASHTWLEFSCFSLSVPPTIADGKHDYIVIVNNPVQIPCEASGVPPPTITWFRNGAPFE